MLWGNPAQPFAILTKATCQRLVVTWLLPTSGGRLRHASAATRLGWDGSSFIYSSWQALEIERQFSCPGDSRSCRGRRLLVSLPRSQQAQMLIVTERAAVTNRDFKGEHNAFGYIRARGHIGCCNTFGVRWICESIRCDFWLLGQRQVYVAHRAWSAWTHRCS